MGDEDEDDEDAWDSGFTSSFFVSSSGIINGKGVSTAVFSFLCSSVAGVVVAVVIAAASWECVVANTTSSTFNASVPATTFSTSSDEKEAI